MFYAESQCTLVTAGNFTSPDYPDNYPAYADVCWTMVVDIPDTVSHMKQKLFFEIKKFSRRRMNYNIVKQIRKWKIFKYYIQYHFLQYFNNLPCQSDHLFFYYTPVELYWIFWSSVGFPICMNGLFKILKKQLNYYKVNQRRTH